MSDNEKKPTNLWITPVLDADMKVVILFKDQDTGKILLEPAFDKAGAIAHAERILTLANMIPDDPPQKPRAN